MSRPKIRVSAIELAVWALAVFVVSSVVSAAVILHLVQRPFIFGEITAAEMQAFAERYGPERHSDQAEEWIVRDYFHDKRGGTFVDVGANDYKRFSNTYYLETALGWSGIAIEPQMKFAAGYAAHRPRTRFVPLFVSDVTNATARLYVPYDDQLASSSRLAAGAKGGPVAVVEAETSSLDDILSRTAMSHIDFFSLDIELAEPKALAGFSIERFRPALACVEAHLPVRQAILDYFGRHHYRLIGRYLRADERNLWFEPDSGG